jgi:hypothetical protein
MTGIGGVLICGGVRVGVGTFAMDASRGRD